MHKKSYNSKSKNEFLKKIKAIENEILNETFM